MLTDITSRARPASNTKLRSGNAIARYEHESYTDIVLRECADCFLYYDPRKICSSVVLRLMNLTDEDARGYAERLFSFVKERFTLSHLLQFSREQLISVSKSRPFPNHTLTPRQLGDELSFDDGSVLEKMSCQRIKDRCVLTPNTFRCIRRFVVT